MERGKDKASTSHNDFNPTASRAQDTVQRGSRVLSKLLKKMQKVGNPDIVAAAEDFMIQIQSSEQAANTGNYMPAPYNLTSSPDPYNGDAFLRMLPRLATAIELSVFGEQEQRIRKRIALAHFYHAYSQAQERPQLFFSWCSLHLGSSMPKLSKSGFKSAVQRRFAELMFPPTAAWETSKDSAKDWMATRINKIQTWRKYGKGWAKLIMRFGYAILLFVPPSLADEE